MAERRDPQYEETNDPHNPPRAVLNRDVRRAAVWIYVGPLVALLVIVGIALIYWMGRDGREGDETLEPTATSGEQIEQPAPRDAEQGGGEPAPRPDNTRDEIEFRGGRDGR